MRQYPAGQELAELLLHEARQRGAVRVMSRRLRLYIGFRWRGVRLSAGADRARPASGGAGVAVGQDRLRLLADGRVVLTLKSAWRDGTRRLLFELLTLLEKLAALIPRPRINLVVYPGVLAPHCGWRARVVAYGAPPAVASPCSETPEASRSAPRHWAWAALMRRAFDVDVRAWLHVSHPGRHDCALGASAWLPCADQRRVPPFRRHLSSLGRLGIA